MGKISCETPAEDNSTGPLERVWTSPLDAENIGMLKPGAEDHGLVAAVAVTVPLAITIDVLVTASPPVLPGMTADDPSVPSASLTYW